jgi:hypothetical protein
VAELATLPSHPGIAAPTPVIAAPAPGVVAPVSRASESGVRGAYSRRGASGGGPVFRRCCACARATRFTRSPRARCERAALAGGGASTRLEALEARARDRGRMVCNQSCIASSPPRAPSRALPRSSHVGYPDGGHFSARARAARVRVDPARRGADTHASSCVQPYFDSPEKPAHAWA